MVVKSELSSEINSAIDLIASRSGLAVFLSGAGISAESGIPTFRGEEGYWRVGAREYRPEQMATHAAFEQMPAEVWRWYLYRRAVCRGAAPNPGHQMLVKLEETLGDDFLLVTQNVDGLHLRAGQSAARTYEVHGNIDYMRCDAGCTAQVPLPDSAPLLERDQPLGTDKLAELRCSICGGPTRPHVLWFDECYDESLYRFESSLEAMTRAAVLVTIGTSGATNLPSQMVARAAQREIPIIDINPSDNPFAEVARSSGGISLEASAGAALPRLAKAWLER